MQAFQKDLEQFEKLNAQVLAVSPDSLETHKKFAEKYKFDFPLIADEGNAVRKLYDKGRITYLIDKKGIIRFVQKGVPENRDFLEKLREIGNETMK
jgi:peroxiredoxin Q/BCP